MIEIKKVSFQHENAEKPSLKNVSLTIAEGECVLLCGESGSGKTTVTRLINGLIPHFYEGKMEGCAMVNGLNRRQRVPEPPQSVFLRGHHQ